MPTEEEKNVQETAMFTLEEVAARLEAAEARWKREAEEAREAERASAYAEGEAAARADMQPKLDAARAETENLRRSAARRERELVCMRMLRERSLDEGLTPLLMAAEEDQTERCADMLAAAVENAARQMLCERAAALRPTAGSDSTVTGKMLRDLPIAKLAEMMR